MSQILSPCLLLVCPDTKAAAGRLPCPRKASLPCAASASASTSFTELIRLQNHPKQSPKWMANSKGRDQRYPRPWHGAKLHQRARQGPGTAGSPRPMDLEGQSCTPASPFGKRAQRAFPELSHRERHHRGPQCCSWCLLQPFSLRGSPNAV